LHFSIKARRASLASSEPCRMPPALEAITMMVSSELSGAAHDALADPLHHRRNPRHPRAQLARGFLQLFQVHEDETSVRACYAGYRVPTEI
jgi:hypothetical protein